MIVATVSKTLFRSALLIAASIGLSGCVYDVGLGYASDSYYDRGYAGGDYYNRGYSCDPFGGYDAYYNCDYGQGFANIGFGGGWYENYYYPGYGFFLFDNVGRRYPMGDHHRRYWGERRHYHYREHRRRNRDDRGYEGRETGYTNDATSGVIARSEQVDGRVGAGIESGRERRREGRRSRMDQWQDVGGNGSSAVPVPSLETIQEPGRGRSRLDRAVRPNPNSDGMNTGSVAPQRAPQNIMTEQNPPAPRAMPAPRLERKNSIPSRARDVGENIRDE